jgi:hypothetical protein
MRMTRGYARGAAGAEVTPCAFIASPRLTVRWGERRSTIGSSAEVTQLFSTAPEPGAQGVGL